MTGLIPKLLPGFTAMAIFVVGGSLIHPFGNVASMGMKTRLLSGAEVDSETLALFQRGCQNCHSLNTQMPFYGRIAPMSWLMARDVEQARSHLNLSGWREYSPENRITLLSEIGSAVKNRQMPVERYLLLHPEARLSDQERERIYQWTRAERMRLKSELSPSGADRPSTVPLPDEPELLEQSRRRVARR